MCKKKININKCVEWKKDIYLFFIGRDNSLDTTLKFIQYLFLNNYRDWS